MVLKIDLGDWNFYDVFLKSITYYFVPAPFIILNIRNLVQLKIKPQWQEALTMGYYSSEEAKRREINEEMYCLIDPCLLEGKWILGKS